jgi:hypothetical protein
VLKGQFACATIGDLTELSKYQQDKASYLLYESITGVKFVFSVDRYLASQFLRRVVCEQMGQPDVWDWRIHPFRDKLERFVSSYRQLRSTTESSQVNRVALTYPQGPFPGPRVNS